MSLNKEHNLPRLEFGEQVFPLGAKVDITCTNLQTNEVYTGKVEIWGIKPFEDQIELKFFDDKNKPHYFNTTEAKIEKITLL